MTSTRLIEISKLEKSPLNARKTLTQASVEDMKASIAAHGLMQNLVVTEADGDCYHVIAGSRRLAALHELQADGKLPADHAVPCQIVTEEHAAELSLAENVIRAAMHPADEFEAFAALADKGRSVDEIAFNFGVTAKHVEQRMKLARVAPELLAAYRDEEMTLEVLMAFTVSDDHGRQLAVWKGLQSWQRGNAGGIRRMLTEETLDSRDTVAAFVGLDAYVAAGGTVRTDLFNETVYLDDPELVNRLAGEKLEVVRAELEAAGWGWVEISPEEDWSFVRGCGRIEPQPLDAPADVLAELEAAQAALKSVEQEWDEVDSDDDEAFDDVCARKDKAEETVEAIEAKLESFAAFDQEQMKLAGCYVTIRRNGELEIYKGLVRKEDQKKLSKPQDGTTAAQADEPKGLSQSLVNDLKAYRLVAAQAEIAKHPEIAFDLLVFKAARSICGLDHAYDGPQIGFTRNYGGMVSKDARDLIGSQMKAAEKTLSLGWLKKDNEGDQFAGFQKLDSDQKRALLAYCIAVTLQPKLAPDDDCPSAYDLSLAATGGSVAAYWRPTQENYLGRITKDQLLGLGADIFGQQWASHRRNSKKAGLVAELHQCFADPDKHGKTPEQVEKLKTWLPAGMAFGKLPEAKPVKAKKGKKAA